MFSLYSFLKSLQSWKLLQEQLEEPKYNHLLIQAFNGQVEIKITGGMRVNKITHFQPFLMV